jgi:hypothetical protein
VQRSLWREVHTALSEGTVMRSQLDERFSRVESKSLSAVLNDLVDSGLAYCSGRGRRAVYGLTPQKDLERLLHDDDELSLAQMVWLQLATQGAQSSETLARELGVAITRVQRSRRTMPAHLSVLPAQHAC